MTELDLRETLERHLDAVDVPPAPLGPVVAEGPPPAPPSPGGDRQPR